ncbi:MAG: crossover junction endodeoxyribonuclease RuvC [Vampirovibrionia bacterium]
MKILGIDPGTARLGFAIIESYDSNNLYKLLQCGIIETSKFDTEAQRLTEIRLDLLDLINTFKPDVVAIEQLFFFKNLKTVIPVAQARGVVLQLAHESKMQIFEYTPLQVKQIITGRGRAEKSEVESFVMADLQLTEKIRPDDAVDAVAIALCFLRSDYQKFVRIP